MTLRDTAPARSRRRLADLADLIQLETRYQQWLANDALGICFKTADDETNRRYFAAVHA